MKKLLILFTVTALGITLGHSASMQLGPGTTPVDIKSSGQTPTLPTFLTTANTRVRLGFFRTWVSGALSGSLTGATATNRAGNSAVMSALSDPTIGIFSYIATNFVPIGETGADPDYGLVNPAGANGVFGVKEIPSAPGRYTVSGSFQTPGNANNWIINSASTPPNSVQDAGLVRGTKLFLLIYAGGTGNDDASELGIYSADEWFIPTSSVLHTASFNLGQVDNSLEVYRGAIGSLITAPVIPEPSTSLLALLSGLLFIRRRR